MSLVYTSKVDLPNYMWTNAIIDIANLDVELMMNRECSYVTGVCYTDKVLVPERLVIKIPREINCLYISPSQKIKAVLTL